MRPAPLIRAMLDYSVHYKYMYRWMYAYTYENRGAIFQSRNSHSIRTECINLGWYKLSLLHCYLILTFTTCGLSTLCIGSIIEFPQILRKLLMLSHQLLQLCTLPSLRRPLLRVVHWLTLCCIAAKLMTNKNNWKSDRQKEVRTVSFAVDTASGGWCWQHETNIHVNGDKWFVSRVTLAATRHNS